MCLEKDMYDRVGSDWQKIYVSVNQIVNFYFDITIKLKYLLVMIIYDYTKYHNLYNNGIWFKHR